MRRLVVEFDMTSVNPNHPLNNVKTFEILRFLRLSKDEFSAIMKVQFGARAFEVSQLFPDTDGLSVHYELLEKGEDSLIYFVRVSSKGKAKRPLRLSPIAGTGFITTPFELKDGKLRVTYIAENREVRSILGRLGQSKMRHKVISMTDAKISPDSPLSCLTKRQLDAVINAFELGYYDRPKRINSEQLAEKMGITKATFVSHRRKAERRLLATILANIPTGTLIR